MTAPIEDADREAVSGRIEALVAHCEAIGDRGVREPVLELLRLILELHRAGVAGMIEAAAEAPHLEAAIAAWNRSPEVMLLVELHGLRDVLQRAAEQQRIRPSPTPDFVPVEALNR